ncbi:sensor histidine kinase [Streptomyces sp. NPDC087218]|uniref:sensor histidine kinase n=1 Tax=Streptomyces sp. NPDC087218 TaxID=3365769 RepID=UPI00382B63AE
MPDNARIRDCAEGLAAPAPPRRPTAWHPRADLLTARSQPLPPLAWPRSLRLLPHTLVVLTAVALAATGADTTARLLAAAHAATVVVALRRPVPAWWLSTGLAVGIVLGHPPTSDNELWVWAVQACVLFLLALRVPTPSAALVTAISGLVMLILDLAGAAVGPWPLAGFGFVLFALAPTIGAMARGRREDRARLTEQIAATAQERALRTVLEERARIARELHDVVAHHMSMISIQADAAPHRVPDPPQALVTEFASIRATAQEGLGELRRLLGLLRAEPSGDELPTTAPQPSLARLDTLLASVRATGLPVTAHTGGTPRPLPPGVELSAYRIVQEALSNVLRHAPGATATVQVDHGRSTLRLRITNTSATRPAAPSPGAGHGLTGMRERATMLGGELSAGPAPDGGFEVTAALPVPPYAEEPAP